MIPTIATIVGKNIQKLRESKKYSIIELSDICDIDRTYLSNVEKGNRNVSITILEKISIGLEVDIKELFLLGSNFNDAVCYKFSEGIEVLKEKLTIGKEYLFSDMLQEEKNFKVEWRKGTLKKIERHPNSANCFVSDGQYFLYARELDY